MCRSTALRAGGYTVALPIKLIGLKILRMNIFHVFSFCTPIEQRVRLSLRKRHVYTAV